MRKVAVLVAMALSLSPVVASAQDGRTTIDAVARALGAANLKSIEVSGSGVSFQAGQSAAPGMPWPRFNVKSFTRSISYETASLRDQIVRTQGEDPPRGGGLQPVRGEQRQVFVVSGDHAWNVVGDNVVPAPIALAERQMQFWATPHGVVKAAMTGNATVQGRTLAFGVPGRFRMLAALDEKSLVERIDAVLANPVLGDMPVQVTYADYKDFDGVKFPTKIRQTVGGFPTLDLTITDVRPNAAVDLRVPDTVRQAPSPYAKVASEKVADGVWYLTGGSHHSVVIEMKDHVIVVESPLNDERALAVLAETRKLVPGKPISYVINSHHHFDHSGGLRAFVAEGVTVVTHEVNRTFFQRVLGTPATVNLDSLAKSPRRALVEGVTGRRVMTDGTRVVEILHIAGNPHDDGLLMVYLPKEKLLSQADAYTPPAPNVAPPSPPSPFTLNLVENVRRQGLAVDRLLPLHGRIVPIDDLRRAAGLSN